MAVKMSRKSHKQYPGKPAFYLFRHFYLLSVVAIAVILAVACLGLRCIFRNLVLGEAERDAFRVSYAICDREIEPFMQSHRTKEHSLFIPPEEMPQLDRKLRTFLAPFDIVKIKVFDRDTRIIYSTDPRIIGKLDTANTKLAKALSGTAVSKYETKEHVWDLESEERHEVAIVETYVPVYNDAGEVVGSFEIYKDVTEDFHIADNILLRAGSVFFIALLSVFSALLFIIHRAAEAIKSSTVKLISSNKKLEKEVDDRKRTEKEKRELEAQVRQTQKLEALGTLAGGITHDFNNILAAILGYVDLALEDTPDGSLARSNLEQVLIAGSRAKNLVRQILTFSRKTEQKQEPMEIAPIVKEALKMLRSSIPATIEIRRNIESDRSVITADSTQIHQILMNLCTNASHAMDDDGGVLGVSLTDFDIESALVTDYGTLQPGSYVKLTINDTGCGMDSKVAERIFEPFFTTKPVDKGTGMGLSVVHGIVENHGGVITVQSQLGKGTTFDIYLPRIESPDTHQTQTVQIPRGKGEVILVVDDEKPIVDMMKQMLERLGYAVVGKTGSIDALDTFRAEPDSFDLVITDYAMPNMTGKELAEALMAVRPDIPVILCTGFSESIDAERAKSMGIKEFVMKPVARSEIAATIRNVLDKKEITV